MALDNAVSKTNNALRRLSKALKNVAPFASELIDSGFEKRKLPLFAWFLLTKMPFSSGEKITNKK